MNNKFITTVDSIVDVHRLQMEVDGLEEYFGLENESQITLTSIDGNDDWKCGNGVASELKYPERYYSVLNRYLSGSYIEECIKKYPEFYRWRILKLFPGMLYPVHTDSGETRMNSRIHLPVFTNHESFLCFYDTKPHDGSTNLVHHHHLAGGSAYSVDTDTLHTAVNYGSTIRTHIVGTFYENRNNRTH